MKVYYSFTLPAHICRDTERLQAIVERVFPQPPPDDLTVTCSYPEGLVIRFSLEHASVHEAYVGIRRALNLGHPTEPID